MSHKTALVLSGGGALGAFQVGAERYAREVKGCQWSIIAGVSVGAVNGAMIAMGKSERLFQIWSSEMSNRLVFGPLGRTVPTGLLGLRSLYPHWPIRRLAEREFGEGKFQTPLRVGAVSLMTGEYKMFAESDPHILDALLASATMPIVWPPVDVGAEYPWMVDGGVRNTTPIGDVLNQEPEEIIIINCNPENIGLTAKPPRTLVGIGIRSFEIVMNEIFRDDIREFIWINALVREAAAGGVVLHHPKDGHPLRYVPYKIIEPEAALGDSQDFSGEQATRLLAEGWRKAEQVLG